MAKLAHLTLVFCLLVAKIPGVAVPPNAQRGDLKLTLQDITSRLGDIDHRLRGQEVDLEILHEKMNALDKEIASHKNEEQKLASSQLNCLDKRCSQMEKDQVGISQDLKLLKQHIEKNGLILSSCQSRIGELEKHLASDIDNLKKSIQSVLALLQEEEAHLDTYIVQPGDSLGKIALKHKINVEKLKTINNLTNDTIFVGQKLKLPT